MNINLHSLSKSTDVKPTKETTPHTLNLVVINHEPVELCKILKFENLVLSGGEAKQVIAGRMVTVNGKVETRKRKKIFAGDIVGFNGQQMKIELQLKK